MNEESSSKRTYKITLTCQSALPLISLNGEQKTIMSRRYKSLQASLQDTLLDYEASLVIPMEVEEVNPSPSSPLKKQRSTKTPSTTKLTSAKLPATEEAVVCNHTYYYDGHSHNDDAYKCSKCGHIDWR
jgi:hypothetical protein